MKKDNKQRLFEVMNKLNPNISKNNDFNVILKFFLSLQESGPNGIEQYGIQYYIVDYFINHGVSSEEELLKIIYNTPHWQKIRDAYRDYMKNPEETKANLSPRLKII